MIRTKGSLCTGTGSLDAATPGVLTWLAETDDAASRLLKREHPDVPNLGDITMPDFAPPHVDLLTSGDPCQSMSAAGRQMASDDTRFLWPDVMRVIDQVRPDHLFLENVQNIASVALVKGGERGGVLKLRLDNLREAGYAVRWTVLGACAVGAPHHRHRWFLRAVHVGGGAPEAERVVVKCGAPRNGGRFLLPSPRCSDGARGGELTRAERTRTGGTLLDAVKLLPTPAARDFKGCLDGKRDGGPNLNNVVALLPTPHATDAGAEGRRSSEGWRPQLGPAVRENVLLPTPRATDGTNGGPKQRGRKGDLAMGTAVQAECWGKFAEAVALWEQITGRPAPDPTEPAPKGGRRLNAALSEWMMGMPEGHVTHDASRNEALRMAGNGVVALQARAAWDLLEADRAADPRPA